MEPVKKNYSIFAHAMHSRLQLIRDKIDTNPEMTAQEMVSLNKKYFDLIADSVDTYHHYKAGRTDYMNAAELFLSTLNRDGQEIQN